MSVSIDLIMAFENGELGEAETVRLFADLVKTGMAWRLQGSYGRGAKALIDQGYISGKGEVLRLPDEYDNDTDTQ